MARGAGRMARGAARGAGRAAASAARAIGGLIARLAVPVGVVVAGLTTMKGAIDKVADALRDFYIGLAESRKDVDPRIAGQLAINQARLQMERFQMVNQGFGRRGSSEAIARQAELQGNLDRKRQEAALAWEEVGVNLTAGLTAELTKMQTEFAAGSAYMAKIADWVTEDPLAALSDIADMLLSYFDAEANERNEARKAREKEEERRKELTREQMLAGIRGNLATLMGPSIRNNPNKVPKEAGKAPLNFGAPAAPAGG